MKERTQVVLKRSRVWPPIPLFMLTAGLLVLPAPALRAEWRLEQVDVLSGFMVPECVLVAPDGSCFVSNIESEPGKYWSDDGKGFITRFSTNGTCIARRWLNSTPEAVLNAPKGMCLFRSELYFADNKRLQKCSLGDDPKPVVIPIEGAQQLNDIATDRAYVYVSDTGAGLIYRVDVEGKVKVLQAPPAVNGVTCHEGKIYAVSWLKHDLYEVDPSGEKPAEPFGLADHFTNLDGIEVLSDGSFLVSDFMGNQVCRVSPDRKTVDILAKPETPADIGLDRERSLLYVPKFMKNEVDVYRLVP